MGRYTDDDLKEIVRRALLEQEDPDGFTRDELVAAAREVGLDPSEVDRAEAALVRERDRETIRRRLSKRARGRWQWHAAAFVVLAGGLLGMTALGFAGVWTWWLAYVWGAVLALHTFGVVRGPSEERVDAVERRQNRHARRAERARARREERSAAREARRERERAPASPGVRSPSIEEGVAMLLRAAAARVQHASGASEAGSAPATEFERFVARQRAKERGAPPSEPPVAAEGSPSKGPRVRVAGEPAPETEEAPATSSDRRRAARKS